MLAPVRIVLEPGGASAHAGARRLLRRRLEYALEIAHLRLVGDLMINDLRRAEPPRPWECKLVFLHWHFDLTVFFSYFFHD